MAAGPARCARRAGAPPLTGRSSDRPRHRAPRLEAGRDGKAGLRGASGATGVPGRPAIMPAMSPPFARLSRRRAHLDADNPLRALTEVIGRVPDGINLGQGVCDLATPPPLVRGALESIRGGDRQTYTHYSGLPELKAQIRRKLAGFNGLDVDDDQILVTAGSSAAFYAACTALLDPGDEVVVLEPFYSYHYTALRLLEAKPVPVPLVSRELVLDPAKLAAAIGERTRALVLNTPGNPSGRVLSHAELEAIAGVLSGTDVVVLTDEVYEYMCFDGRRHVSPATVPGLAERTLTISSFSKTFSITGWRIGYLAGPAEVVEAIGRVFDQIDVCAARPMQRGVERALRELPASFYEDLRAGYEDKRDRFCDALERAGFACLRPQGAYYVLADYREVLGDMRPYDAARTLIERIGVNGVPADLFYADGEEVRSIRFQFAVEDAVLDEVCRRFERLGAGRG